MKSDGKRLRFRFPALFSRFFDELKKLTSQPAGARRQISRRLARKPTLITGFSTARNLAEVREVTQYLAFVSLLFQKLRAIRWVHRLHN